MYEYLVWLNRCPPFDSTTLYTSHKAKVIMIKLTILTITGLVLFGITNAYADHVDNNIWIETAEGSDSVS